MTCGHHVPDEAESTRRSLLRGAVTVGRAVALSACTDPDVADSHGGSLAFIEVETACT